MNANIITKWDCIAIENNGEHVERMRPDEKDRRYKWNKVIENIKLEIIKGKKFGLSNKIWQ